MRPNRYLYPAAALCLFLIPALILVLLNFNFANPAGAASDQNLHHLPGVIAFSEHWDYLPVNVYSPNIPGYYILFGAFRHWITHSIVGLRVINLLLTTGLVCSLLAAVSPGCPPILSAFLVTPFMFSDSVFSRGIWLGTDNPAWWGILVLLWLALRRRMSLLVYVVAGLLFVCVTGIRQNQIWVIPFMVFAAFLGQGEEPRLDRASVRRAAGMAIAAVPATAMVAWYVYQWRGLVTPAFQGSHQEFSLSTIPMVFALLGILGVFFLPVVWPGFARAGHRTARPPHTT
jgi:hypothetical protein